MAISQFNFGLQLDLQISDKTQALTAEKFGLGPAQMARAERRAINKVARWFAGKLRGAVARKFGAKQKYIKNRFRVRQARAGRRSGGNTAYIWFGTNDLDPVEANFDGEEIGTGYMAGQYFFEGGFLAYQGKSYKAIYARKGKKRLPIIKQGIKISDYINELVRRFIRAGDIRLLKVFKQELNFEMHKSLGNV